jgi:hypothetical protein
MWGWVWASEPVWTLWNRENFFCSTRNRTSAAQPVAFRYIDWTVSVLCRKPKFAAVGRVTLRLYRARRSYVYQTVSHFDLFYRCWPTRFTSEHLANWELWVICVTCCSCRYECQEHTSTLNFMKLYEECRKRINKLAVEHGSVVGWGTATSRKVAGSSPDEVDFFQFT